MFKTVITLYTNEKIPLGEELAKEVAYAFVNGDVQVEYLEMVVCPTCDGERTIDVVNSAGYEGCPTCKKVGLVIPFRG